VDNALHIVLASMSQAELTRHNVTMGRTKSKQPHPCWRAFMLASGSTPSMIVSKVFGDMDIYSVRQSTIESRC
jgi:hypothetical protein